MMELFREKEHIPKRDPNRNVCEHYTSYRKPLREDFNKRCGYCNDNDKFKIRSFAIDHFVPRNPKDFTHTIAPNVYKNLVWSCGYCNSAKSNKWPTKNENLPNDGSIGFVDPINLEYDDLFERNINGEILAKKGSELASYIKAELNLWLPIHSLMWRLEKLKKIELELKEKAKGITDEIIQKEINEIGAEISSIMDEIFEHND